MEEFEGEAEEGGGFLGVAECAADEGYVLDAAGDYVGFVDGEALFFVEVGVVDDAVYDGAFEDGGGVEAVGGEGGGAASFVEEVTGIGAVGFCHDGWWVVEVEEECRIRGLYIRWKYASCK